LHPIIPGKMTRILYRLWIAVSIILLLQGCGSQEKQNEDKALIVCTTSIIADAVREVVGDEIEVKAMMGIGVDPHLYKATTGDVQLMKKADLVVYNGLHLEGKLADILHKMQADKKAYAVAEAMGQQKLIAADEQSFDPHIWFDLELWGNAVEYLGNRLIWQFATSPIHEKQMETRLENYLNRLVLAHKAAKMKLENIPQNSRYLVTAHDAFSYFGRAYGLQLLPLQGISTASDFGIKEIDQLVTTMVNNKIPALFAENSVSPKALYAVIEGCKAQGHQVQEGGTLYSDALGAESQGHHTLIGAFEHNVELIYQGLVHAH